jgi:hypothetical protein
VKTAEPNHAEILPQTYAAWRCRMLVCAIVATAVGLVLHGPTVEIRYESGGDQPSPWLVVGLVALTIGALGPGLMGICLGLAAVWRWRRLGRSIRLARAAWGLWVLGPLPILILPLAHLFHLDWEDSLHTSAHQIRYLLTVTAPAFFALLPGILRAALVLKRFLPESQAPGHITMLAAPACTVAYLIPVGVVAQLAFQPGLYLGLLLLAGSPLVPLLAVRWLLRRDAPGRAAHLVRAIGLAQSALGVVAIALVAFWLGENPRLRDLLGQIDAAWVLGLVAKTLASKWLTTVVVTDLLVSMLHRVQKSVQSLTETVEGEALAQKLDALGGSLRPAERTTG